MTNFNFYRFLLPFLLVLLAGCATAPVPDALRQSGNALEEVAFSALEREEMLNEWRDVGLECDDTVFQRIIQENVLAFGKRGERLNLKLSFPESPALAAPYQQGGRDEHDKRIMGAMQRYVGKQDGRVLFFFHGGLTTFKEAVQRALRDIPRIRGDLCKPTPDARDKLAASQAGMAAFPVFVFWPSSLLDTYFDSAVNYKQGDWTSLGTESLDLSTLYPPLHMATDLAETVVRAPVDWIKSIRRYGNSEGSCFPLAKEVPVMANPLDQICEQAQEVPGFVCQQKLASGRPMYCDNWKEFQYWTVGTAMRVPSVPLIDPIAKRAWQAMRARAIFIMRKPCTLINQEDRIEFSEFAKNGFCLNSGNGARGDLTRFMKSFGQLINKAHARVTLIGHSMGAFIVNQIMRDYDYYELPVENVVYMAAAASIRDYKDDVQSVFLERARDFQCQNDLASCKQVQEKVCGHLRSLEVRQTAGKKRDRRQEAEVSESAWQPTSPEVKALYGAFCWDVWKEEPLFKVYNLTLHPYSESRSKESPAALSPAGSLLEWIDDLYETPHTVEDRTLGKWANVASLPTSFSLPMRRGGYLTHKRFGLSCDEPVFHGDFADTSKTGVRCEDGTTRRMVYWNPEFWR